MVLREWLSLVVLSVIWGSSFLFIEIAIDHAAPLTIVLFRIALAALVLIAYCLVRNLRIPIDRVHLAQYAVMGFISHALPFTLLTWGQLYITAGLASIYNATTPLFTVLVAHLFLADERATPTKVGGVVMGFLGVAVLIGGGLGAVSAQNILGQMAALGAAICYALSIVYGRRFSALPSAGIAAATLTLATVFIAPVVFVVGFAGAALPPVSGIAAIAVLAFVCTALAYIIYYWVLARAGATKLSLVTFLIPASAILLGVVFLNERLAPHHFAGLALILVGLVLVDGQMLRYFPRRRVRGI